VAIGIYRSVGFAQSSTLWLLQRRAPQDRAGRDRAPAPQPAPAWCWRWPVRSLFSAKAIIVKLAYRHGVDAVTLIMYRMLFALPLFLALAWWAGRGTAPLTARDCAWWWCLGFCGYYLASLLDFAGLQYISASLERLILYLNPTLVLAAVGAAVPQGGHARGSCWRWPSATPVCCWCSATRCASAGSTRCGRAAGVRQRVSYAVYLVLQRAGGAAPGRAAPDRLATSVASVLCIVQFLLLRPLSGGPGGPSRCCGCRAQRHWPAPSRRC
jgi:hypothetical protein